MICEHLRWLDEAIRRAGHRETFRGQAWSNDCREWVYYPVKLDIDRLRAEHPFAPTVVVHENTDARSGTERGLVCNACQDGVMGRLEGEVPSFP